MSAIDTASGRDRRLVLVKGVRDDAHIDPAMAIGAAKLTARAALAQLLPADPVEARGVLDRAIVGLERLVSNGPAELAVQAMREVREAL